MGMRMLSSTNGVELELQLFTRTTTRCGEGGREWVAVNRQRSRIITTWQLKALRTHEGKGLPKRDEG